MRQKDIRSWDENDFMYDAILREIARATARENVEWEEQALKRKTALIEGTVSRLCAVNINGDALVGIETMNLDGLLEIRIYTQGDEGFLASSQKPLHKVILGAIRHNSPLINTWRKGDNSLGIPSSAIDPQDSRIKIGEEEVAFGLDKGSKFTTIVETDSLTNRPFEGLGHPVDYIDFESAKSFFGIE